MRGVTPPENSVTNSRADCAFTQQMIGCIKAISPCFKSTSAKLFLDLHTVRVGAEWRGERTLGAAAQVERGYALDGAAAALTVAHTRGVAMPLSWSWSHHSLRARVTVSGCIRAPRYFNPHPVLKYGLGTWVLGLATTAL